MRKAVEAVILGYKVRSILFHLQMLLHVLDSNILIEITIL